MELFLDCDDARSLTTQIYDQLREAIADQRLTRGTRLQPTRTVAQELGVARSTVTEAYARLTAEGFTEGRRGAGSIVLGGVTPTPRGGRQPTALAPTSAARAVRGYSSSDKPVRSRYDLTPGRVDDRLFPVAEWRRCTSRALGRLDGLLGRYGHPAGSAALRHALAQWIAQSRGVAATPEQIVVTNGSANALDLLARVLLRPGDIAAVEDPGYPRFADLLRTLGVHVVGVPVDEHGLIVDALPPRARLVHVTPSHQYPLGSILSRQRRFALLNWANRHGAAIVEDDYDSEFRYTARPLEPLHRMDRDGRVAYVGSFSKTLSPALRVGFVVAPTGLVPALTAVRRAVDFGTSPIVSEALALFIEEGHLARHCRRARKVYAERHRAVSTALDELGPTVTVMPTQAGLHVALLAPNMPDDDAVEARAKQRRLQWLSLRSTYHSSDPQPGVVVGFGAIATADIPGAVAALGECIR